MKCILIVLLFTITLSCGDNDAAENTLPSESIEKERTEILFPNYESVSEMINVAGDYIENCFDELSVNKKETKIRVSSEFFIDEPQESMKEQVKRDIVYVTFQTFAQTSINKVTITSIPILRNDFNPHKPHDGKQQNSLKQTLTVTREKAAEVMLKYAEIESFQDLYTLSGTLYLPNSKFDQLKFEKLNNVFADLKK